MKPLNNEDSMENDDEVVLEKVNEFRCLGTILSVGND